MKKFLFRTAIGLGVVLVAVVILSVMSLNKIVKKGIETVGPEITKVSIQLDGVGLSPWSGRGSIKGLVLGNPEGYKAEYAIKLGQASVQLKPSSVLSDKIVVRSINIEGPEITLEGSGLKNNNLNKILENIDASLGTSSQSQSGKKLQIDELNISGGKIHLSLSVMGGRAITVPLPAIQLKNLGTSAEGVTPGEAIQKTISAVLTGSVKAAEVAIADLGKNAAEVAKKVGEGVTDAAKKATGSATEAADKAAKSIGNLFKK